MSNALFDLSETLRHPSDIQTKLENIEKDCKDKYEIHQKKFNNKMTSAYSQVKKTSEKYEGLGKNIKVFNEVKEKNIQILNDFNYLIKDYRTVKTICLAHQHFLKIKDFIENFKDSDENIEDEDIEKYHNNIYRKEEFVCELEQYNVDVPGEDLNKIEEIIRGIKRQSLDFTLFFLEVVKDFKSNYTHFDKVNKIVEKEETRDDLTRRAKEGEKGNDPVLYQISKMYPRYITRKPKNIKDQIVQVIKASIKEKFFVEKEVFVTELEFVLKDLQFFYEKINLYFFTFTDILSEYHRNLRETIHKNLGELDAGEILKLIEFKTSYYTTIETKYNKIGESLGEKLIENENELLQKYTQTASIKLNTWIENITNTEIEKFITRDGELNKDEDNKLISTGFINLLQMIKIQLEPIAFNKKVFLYITKTVKKYCEMFRKRICDEIEKDFTPSCQGKSKPGYEDYCIVFGNSGLKLTQYITSLPQCQSDEVRELGNIFITILKTCNHFLAEYVIYVCKPATNDFFTPKWTQSFNVCIVTLEDFLQDYQSAMADFTFMTFCHELCECLINVYFKRIIGSKAKYTEETGTLLKRDCKKLLELFGNFINSSDLDEIFVPMNKIVPLVETNSEEMFILELKSLLIAKSDFEEKTVVKLLGKKINWESAMKTKLLEKVHGVYKEREMNEY